MTEKASEYTKAGVNIAENDLANDLIKRVVPYTWDDNVVTDLEGLFSAGYRIDRGRGQFFGQKLVAVNQLSDITSAVKLAFAEIEENQGKVLFTTDYLAFGKLNALAALYLAEIVMFAGRRKDGSFTPLIGGETAEMPGVIKDDGAEIVIAVTYQSREPFHGCVDIEPLEGDILTTSIDSVGTKTKLGLDLGIYADLCENMVGHGVGDTVVQFATPLGFAMYLGFAHQFPDEQRQALVRSAGSLGDLVDFGLVEHSKDIYVPGQVDIVGSTLGLLDGDAVPTVYAIEKGDKLLAVPCFGLNTNGYSLVRRKGDEGLLDYDEEVPGLDGMTAGEAFMVPHENYQEAIIEANNDFDDDLKGVAHITGGGIYDNTRRLLPDGLDIRIDSLPNNPLFAYLEEKGQIPHEQMVEVFNMGAGLVCVVDKDFIFDVLPEGKYHVLGEVVEAK